MMRTILFAGTASAADQFGWFNQIPDAITSVEKVRSQMRAYASSGNRTPVKNTSSTPRRIRGDKIFITEPDRDSAEQKMDEKPELVQDNIGRGEDAVKKADEWTIRYDDYLFDDSTPVVISHKFDGWDRYSYIKKFKTNPEKYRGVIEDAEFIDYREMEKDGETKKIYRIALTKEGGAKAGGHFRISQFKIGLDINSNDAKAFYDHLSARFPKMREIADKTSEQFNAIDDDRVLGSNRWYSFSSKVHVPIKAVKYKTEPIKK